MVSNAQIQKKLNLMPWPQNINLTEGTFFKQEQNKITGEPNGRILLVQLTFTSIGWQNRIVLEQAF
jgi:hexosaminidase